MKKIILLVTVATLSVSLLIMSIFYQRRSQVAGITSTETLEDISGVIVPHHELAAPLLSQAFERVDSNDLEYATIVILSPNHSTTLDQFVTTSQTLPDLLIDSEKVQSLTDALPFVTQDKALLTNEHGVMVPAQYVTHYFPDTPIIPLAISPYYKDTQLSQLVSYLSTQIPGKVLFVQSSDFSHNSMADQAFDRHQTMVRIIESLDYPSLKVLDDNYLDSPVPMEIFLKVMQQKQATVWEFVGEGHSSMYLNNPGILGTSYITGLFGRRIDPY